MAIPVRMKTKKAKKRVVTARPNLVEYAIKEFCMVNRTFVDQGLCSPEVMREDVRIRRKVMAQMGQATLAKELLLELDEDVFHCC